MRKTELQALIYYKLNFMLNLCKKKRAIKARYRILYFIFSFQKLLQLQVVLYRLHLLRLRHDQQIQ